MKESIDQALPTTRRGFLQLGMMGTATLALGSTIATLSGCTSSQEARPNSEFKFLNASDREIFKALGPAVLSHGFPGELTHDAAMNRLLLALDDLMFSLQYHNKTQMRQLFDALSIAPLRVIAGAPWADWKDMEEKEVNDFLIGWRSSRLQLKRLGYVALSKLISICWYSQPESFVSTGYPGPPTKIPTLVMNTPVSTAEHN